ncbi:hypothetical protein CEW81_21495 [Kluyvera genomosp. 3]|uniref:SLH domain-containing protein n=1 Tax=Kluyvera genomosp. 3 TaxID=2774055 RepID=A0A248KK14_9ENTR|nr:hypothetical protein CEW81_21495 [Kluyvera genomosp. 3]
MIEEESGAECITRFELAQMIIRLWGLQYQPSNGVVIQDIAPDSVWYPGIAALIQRGMMALVQGKFLPDRPIRREEAATVAMMSCGVSYRNASTMLQSTFTDGRILRDIYLTNAQRRWLLALCAAMKKGASVRAAIYAAMRRWRCCWRLVTSWAIRMRRSGR